jgi:hypothetical protein
MLAARTFAAPARQCLRQTSRSSRWAPALSQVSFPRHAHAHELRHSAAERQWQGREDIQDIS